MTETIISLVRHGEVYNPHKTYYGRLPRFLLSENGRIQAANTARYLLDAQITAVYSSPLLRARQTATIISTQLALPLHISKFLLEAYTPHDGRPLAELDQRDWDVYTDSPPEFEQPIDIVERMSHFIGNIRRKHAGGHTVLVTHADPVAWTVMWASKMEWAAKRPLQINDRRRLKQAGLPVNYPYYASVVTMRFDDEGKRPFAMSYTDMNSNKE